MINRKRCVLRSGKVQKKLTPMSRKIMKKEKGVYLLGYIDYLKVRQHCLDPTDPMFPALHTCDCECEWLSGSMNQSCHWLYSFYPPTSFCLSPNVSYDQLQPTRWEKYIYYFPATFFSFEELIHDRWGCNCEAFFKKRTKVWRQKKVIKMHWKKICLQIIIVRKDLRHTNLTTHTHTHSQTDTHKQSVSTHWHEKIVRGCIKPAHCVLHVRSVCPATYVLCVFVEYYAVCVNQAVALSWPGSCLHGFLFYFVSGPPLSCLAFYCVIFPPVFLLSTPALLSFLPLFFHSFASPVLPLPLFTCSSSPR